jgi:probable rRNA maturation factor
MRPVFTGLMNDHDSNQSARQEAAACGDEDAPGQCSPANLPDGSPAVQVVLNIETDQAGDCDPTWLTGKLQQIIDQLALRRAVYTAVVVDDAQMSRMHEQYAGVTGTTDVLTFDLADPPRSDVVEGEAYLCIDEARRRVADLPHDLNTELLLYATHGLLHLLGYDDHDPAGHEQMHRREDELLEMVGVGRAFGIDGDESS